MEKHPASKKKNFKRIGIIHRSLCFNGMASSQAGVAVETIDGTFPVPTMFSGLGENEY